ncbi:hypothetical protein Moror_12105 [Moniliophthora roreri MCA 2997]|uniref:Uncharacterized protein n=1 Tax=Moniliophthora roreri (strain MCA 2997) TaxID=1381753 RepID=V2WTL0_MONRO|nr:hypothetical protein Moror_12105 [Moniliophthora roreri MCA 2997]
MTGWGGISIIFAAPGMSSLISEDLGFQLSPQVVIVYQIVSLSAMYFVYGFYVLLLGTCVYMMRSRQQGNERVTRSLHLSLTVALFVFSTAFVVVYTFDMVYEAIIFFNTVKTQDYELFVDSWLYSVELTVVNSLELFLGILLNITAEWMLIHRCYLVWGFKKRVVVPLIVASVLTNATGLVGTIITTIGENDTSTIDSDVVLYDVGSDIIWAYEIALSPAMNSILTLLTAGRIWWIHRQVRAHNIHTTSGKLLYSVSRIILESGSLYPVLSIVGLVLRNATTADALPLDFFPLVTLSAGIAPTLIIVRAKYCKNIENLQDQVPGIHFASRPAPQEGTTTVSRVPVHSIGNLSMAAAEAEGLGGNEDG